MCLDSWAVTEENMETHLSVLCRSTQHVETGAHVEEEREMPLILRVMPQFKCCYVTAVVIVCLCV